MTRHSILVITCAAFVLLLAACQPAISTTNSQPTQPPAQPTVQPSAVPTARPTAGPTSYVKLDLAAVAQQAILETVPAVPSSAEGLWYEVLPEYRLLTLKGYPVDKHNNTAQIFIYPADGLTATNEAAGKAVADLKALLKTRKAGDQMPFMPLPFSSRQAMDVQVQYLDFKGGSGVRFLTQFNNGLAAINNQQLIYAFQGLTSDGKYYLAAVLPVTNPELLPTSLFPEGQAKAGKEYQDYLSKTVTSLNQQPGGNFTPDLAKLDALIQSIEVK